MALGSTSGDQRASLRWPPGGFGSILRILLTCSFSSLSSEHWSPRDGMFELRQSRKHRLWSSPRDADSRSTRLVQAISWESLERLLAPSVERPISPHGLQDAAGRVYSYQPPAARPWQRALWECRRSACWTTNTLSRLFWRLAVPPCGSLTFFAEFGCPDCAAELRAI